MSTTPAKTAAVAIEWTNSHARVVDVRQRLAAHDVVDLIAQERDCLWAVDVPFGWPDLFVEVMPERHDRPLPKSQLPESANWGMWRTQLVAQRQTDMYVTKHPRIKTRPLPASFQMLGATAAMWVLIQAELLERGVQIDRSGMSGTICETYPTAALAAWGAPKSGKLDRDGILGLFPFLAIDRYLLVPSALVCRLRCVHGLVHGSAHAGVVGGADTDRRRSQSSASKRCEDCETFMHRPGPGETCSIC